MDFWLLSQLPLQVCLRGNLPLPVALPLFAAASGGREACQSQKLLEGLEHLTVCHPQIMISAEGNLSQAVLLRGRSSTGKEVCVWGEELTFPPIFSKCRRVLCMDKSTFRECQEAYFHILLPPAHRPSVSRPIPFLQWGYGVWTERGLQGLLQACSVYLLAHKYNLSLKIKLKIHMSWRCV